MDDNIANQNLKHTRGKHQICKQTNDYTPVLTKPNLYMRSRWTFLCNACLFYHIGIPIDLMSKWGLSCLIALSYCNVST